MKGLLAILILCGCSTAPAPCDSALTNHGNHLNAHADTLNLHTMKIDDLMDRYGELEAHVDALRKRVEAIE